MIKLNYLLSLPAIFLSISLFAQTPKIIPVKISDNIYVLYGGNGQGANVGVFIGADGLILIDAMKLESSAHLEKVIRLISDKPIKYVINTHADSDHTEGNSQFREKGAKIIAHSNVRYEGSDGDIYFENKMILSEGKEQVELYSVTSHSFSDVLILFREANVLFMGDTFTNSWYATFNSGGVDGQLECINLAKTLSNEQTVIVPGHGILDNLTGMTNYETTTRNWKSRIIKVFQEGYSIERMMIDDELQQIKNSFIHPKTGKQIPNQRLRRFIERTISTELTSSVELNRSSLTAFCGTYKLEDGSTEEVILEGEKLLIRKNSPYLQIAELIPQSSNRFHLRGSIDMFIEFSSSGYTFIQGETSEFATKQ